MIIYPLQQVPEQGKTIFLAGSIEQDTAENWQDFVVENVEDDDLLIMNPRRKNWDAKWKEDIDNPHFFEQVDWELKGQELAKLIVMYFDPNTKSPISLLELGLFAQTKKMIVCCPQGYWKKGNVDIVCRRYNIKQVDNLNELISSIKNHQFD